MISITTAASLTTSTGARVLVSEPAGSEFVSSAHTAGQAVIQRQNEGHTMHGARFLGPQFR